MPCKWIRACPLRLFEQENKISLEWKRKYCEGNYTECVRYQMQENGQPHPDSMMPDGSIDKNLEK
jgi:hypothetical protein